MTLTAAQALGTSPTITLADGSEVPLRYTFRSMALLEQRFGSIMAIQSAMQLAADSQAFGPIMDLLGAALASSTGGFTAHVRHRQDAAGRRTVEEILYRRTADGVDLGELLDLAQVREYSTAMNDAFSIAFGTATGSQGNDASPVTTVTVSPGLT